MNLQSLPNDVWLEIAKRLNVYDILRLRQVSKSLQSITRLRAVWQAVLSQACTQYGVPRLPSQFLHCEDHELEYVACRPSRFQAILSILACESELAAVQPPRPSAKSSRSDHPPTNRFRPIHEYTLPGDSYSSIHLVQGGRWLLTMSIDAQLKLWDLESITPSSEPKPDSASRSDYFRPLRFTGLVPHLYAQGPIPPSSTIMGAQTSMDFHELYVFLRTASPDNDPKVSAMCVKFDLALPHPTDGKPHPLAQVSSWTREAVSLDSTWVKTFGTDLAIFSRRKTRQAAWIWDWRRNLTKKLTRLQVPAGADSLLCMKIISTHLLAVHNDGPRKCTVSLYELPSLPSDPLARPSSEFEREPVQNSSQDKAPAATEPSETQLALFTSKFHGIHHVEAFQPRTPFAGPSARSISSHGISRVTFVDRRSAMHSVPFNVGTVSLSEPFWIVPPDRLEESDPRCKELGSFRIAIGIESAGDAAWRSRLQYYMRVDLNTVGTSAKDDSGSEASGDATVAPPGAIPYPRLRGRVSASRESAIYVQDRLFVASGKLTLLSVWSAADGIHAHTSNVLKLEDRKPRSSKDKRLLPTSVSVRVRPGQPVYNSAIPTAPESSRLKSLAPECYNEMGAEVIAYEWKTPEKVRPRLTMEELLEDALSECSSGSAESLSRKLRRVYEEPSKRSSLGNRLSMKVDLFSGRMVVLDELDEEHGTEPRATVVRVLEYV